MRFTITPLVAIALVVSAISPALCANYSYSVANGTQSFSLASGSGEVQSAVVGPNLKSQCPAGRFFISMDGVRPPQVGTIVGRDLGSSETPDIKSTFGADPDSADQFLTNDDDIVTLGNGDLLLVWGYHSVAPLNPKPGWFDLTYKGTFGPGVRRGSIVYRSTDCGQSFHYSWRFDPARLSGDGLCANPKPPLVGGHYSNGGSDGQLTKVDSNGRVYFTMDCVGSLQDKSQPGFVLGSSYVNRTYVLSADATGSNWTNLGYIPADGWRTTVLALPNGDLAFGALGANFISFGHKAANGGYHYGSTVTPPSALAAGWSDYCTNPVFAALDAGGNCGAAVIASTLVTRIPGSGKIAFAYPATITDSNNKKVDGFELYFYDPASNSFAHGNPILPVVHAASHFIMHLAAIDPGVGPVLLYWVDVDGSSASGPETATIRGRFIYDDGSYSEDFVVARSADGSTREISLPLHRWYGDYHTAGGHGSHGIQPGLFEQFSYYPMWVEGDGTAHFTTVTATESLLVAKKFPWIPLKTIMLYPKWIPGPPPVEIEQLAPRLRAAHPSLDDEADSAGLKMERR